MLTLAILVGLGRPDELKVHVKGALAKRRDEGRAARGAAALDGRLRRPAGVSASRQAAEVLREAGLEPAAQR